MVKPLLEYTQSILNNKNQVRKILAGDTIINYVYCSDTV